MSANIVTGTQCPLSERVDGPWHSWRYDGDDPYVICVYCNEMRDAMTARVVRPGRQIAAQRGDT